MEAGGNSGTTGDTTEPNSTSLANEPPGHPERTGPYRVLNVLGEGGMGVVYEAEQTAPVRRRVAVKIIKLGLDTHQVVARFEAERKALALKDWRAGRE